MKTLISLILMSLLRTGYISHQDKNNPEMLEKWTDISGKLVTQPITTTHHGMLPEESKRRRIFDNMVRFSIGLENAEDLIIDLDNSL